MSDAPLSFPSADSDRSCSTPSAVERFLSSFFRERNIAWMLIAGAVIVFGSSLMLVKDHYPTWPVSLQFLTILGYTAALFAGAEFGRRRLGLRLTYKVLHSLILMLLPVCFLALRWLSSGRAVQSWEVVEFCGLLLIASAFCWFIASRILDHFLCCRQTTFLISYCVLCIAGAFPGFSQSATTAETIFAFLTTVVYWGIMTAGVVKVNRHVFWLVEEHRSPRVFGFLPIVVLGLQFVILAATQTAASINTEWIGLTVVMLAMTVLLTTRTVADVFRQRTGDLVRPYPWEIAMPLFCGLLMTATGVVLSFNGFSYIGETTLAAIPTCIVAAVLMFVAAYDTKHVGFVYVGLGLVAATYQCCPVLFSDLVTSLKQSTAAAIQRSRVPVSMYGITYLPLLACLAAAYRWLCNRNDEFYRHAIKRFATALAFLLLAVSLTDVASRFYVSVASVVTFLTFAIIFRDRRYVVAFITTVILAAAFAIPALNDAGRSISPGLGSVLLAALAVAMTATRVPDRLLHRIPKPSSSLINHRGSNGSWLLEDCHHGDRDLVRLAGGLLAGWVSALWMGESLLHFGSQFSVESLVTFALLISALAAYAIRSPHYLCGLAFWIVLGFAASRWFCNLAWVDSLHVLNVFTCLAVALFVATFVGMKLIVRGASTSKFDALRYALGVSVRKFRDRHAIEAIKDESFDFEEGLTDRSRKIAGLVLPLFDLSTAVCCLVVPIQILILGIANVAMLTSSHSAVSIPFSTVFCIGWIVAAASVFRSRLAAIGGTLVIPLAATAAFAQYGMELSAGGLLICWMATEGTVFLVGDRLRRRTNNTAVQSATYASGLFVQALLVASCLSFDFSFRIVGVVGCVVLLIAGLRRVTAQRKAFFAVLVNVHLILLCAAFVGCHGFVFSSAVLRNGEAALPIVFAVSSISLLAISCLIQSGNGGSGRVAEISRAFDGDVLNGWAAVLRFLNVAFAILLVLNPPNAIGAIIACCVAFVLFGMSEATTAVRERSEGGVWNVCILAALCLAFLVNAGVVVVGTGVSQFALLLVSVVALVVAGIAKDRLALAFLVRPMTVIGSLLPAVVAWLGFKRELLLAGDRGSLLNVSVLFGAAAIYCQRAVVTRRRRFAVMATAIANGAVVLFWNCVGIRDLACYLMPVGLSVLVLTEFLKSQLPSRSVNVLRYVGVFTIVFAPAVDVVSGSWVHMLSLMLLSVVIILSAIGLRIRVLMYSGAVLLFGDVLAMVLHSSIDHPELLWLYGLSLGAAVIALAAYCENHREHVLSRIRLLSDQLANWN